MTLLMLQDIDILIAVAHPRFPLVECVEHIHPCLVFRTRKIRFNGYPTVRFRCNIVVGSMAYLPSEIIPDQWSQSVPLKRLFRTMRTAGLVKCDLYSIAMLRF